MSVNRLMSESSQTARVRYGKRRIAGVGAVLKSADARRADAGGLRPVIGRTIPFGEDGDLFESPADDRSDAAGAGPENGNYAGRVSNYARLKQEFVPAWVAASCSFAVLYPALA
jgi:hypothetical protein